MKYIPNFMIIIVMVISLAISCSPQTQGYLDSGYKNDVAKLPADICFRNGLPIIIGVSTESDGAVALVYVRNNGDIVTKHYPLDFPGSDWKEGGEFYWSGGTCNITLVGIGQE